MESSEETVSRVQREKEALRAEMEAREQRAQAERNELVRELEEMRRRLEEREQERAQAAPAIFENNHLVREMEQRLAQLEKAREEERARAEALQRQNAALQQELEEIATTADEDEEEWSGTEEPSTLGEIHITRVAHRPASEQRVQREQHRLCIPAGDRTLHHVHPVLQPTLEENKIPLAVAATEEINGWSAATEGTTRKWQTDIEKSSFIYGELLANNDLRMQQALVSTLLLSVLITLLSSISVVIGALVPSAQNICAGNTTTPIVGGLNVDHLTWALFAFSIIQTLAAAGIMIWNGLMKIYGWDLNVKNLTKFVQRLDSEWFVFETELNMPPTQRQNGTDFIKRADGDYMHLMQQCPPINGDDYVSANQKYQERLFGNFVWQQKFKKRVEDELSAIRVDGQATQQPLNQAKPPQSPEELV